MSGLSSRGFDADAKFTFVLSVVTGVATLGLSHFLIFLRVKKRALSSHYSAQKVNAIAIPGHQLENGEISADYRKRLARAVSLYHQFDRPVIRILGGRPQKSISEAQAGFDYLIKNNVLPESISLEEVSTNTLENMQHSRQWFAGFEDVILITNRYHLERLHTLAEGLNLSTTPCAAEKQGDAPVIKLLTETLFLHWYWVGRYFAELTCNKRMLDKIS